jgi:diguanylate cyclase (GGDEF)-like protein
MQNAERSSDSAPEPAPRESLAELVVASRKAQEPLLELVEASKEAQEPLAELVDASGDAQKPLADLVEAACEARGRLARLPAASESESPIEWVQAREPLTQLVAASEGALEPLGELVEAAKQAQEPLAGLVEASLEAHEPLASLEENSRETQQRLAELESLYHSAPIGLALLDPSLRYIRINQALADINGLPVAPHLGRTLRTVLPQLAPQLEPIHRKVMESGQAVVGLELSGETAREPGVTRHWLGSFQPVRGLDGRISAISVTMLEITADKQIELASHFRGELQAQVNERTRRLADATEELNTEIQERKRTEERLRQVNEQLECSVQELQERSQKSTALTAIAELIQTCVSAAEARAILERFLDRLFPGACAAGLYLFHDGMLELAAACGETSQLTSVFSPEDCWALRRGKMHVLSGESGVTCRHLTEATGLCAPLLALGKTHGLLHVRPGPAQAMSPERLEYEQSWSATVAAQIAILLANLELREDLRRQAVRDPLTGLFNRRHMEEALHREVRRAVRNRRPLGLLMADLDQFKRFNDAHGHDAGDALLRAFANLLRSEFRAEDIACRYGGEEFLIILPDTPLQVARSRAEQLRESVKRLGVQRAGKSVPITLSVGLAAFPEHGSDREELLRRADQALYQAKHLGRDRVVVAASTPKS